MSLALFPEEMPEEIERGMRDTRLLPNAAVFVAVRDDGSACGFVEVGERSYAEGCESSPVPYIEAWYVDPDVRRRGVGRALLADLARTRTRPTLVGTWAAAGWAIGFYRRHGFELVSPERKAELLRTYWTIPERQIDLSVVLASPPLERRGQSARSTNGPSDVANTAFMWSSSW